MKKEPDIKWQVFLLVVKILCLINNLASFSVPTTVINICEILNSNIEQFMSQEKLRSHYNIPFYTDPKHF